MDTKKLKVPKAYERLDCFLTESFPEHSRRFLQSLIRQGQVILNGKVVDKCAQKLHEGDTIAITFPSPPSPTLTPVEMPLSILYEDEDLLILNKPPGVSVHPGAGNQEATLVQGLLGLSIPLSRYGGKDRPGIVHRLDKETSGCLVIAKNDAIHKALAESFALRKIHKQYLALVWGPCPLAWKVDQPIGRHRYHRKKMAVTSTGKPALTHFKRIDWKPPVALVLAEPITGRTHQIRVHLAYHKTPIIGDKTYSRRKAPERIDRLALHAWKIRFLHPKKGVNLQITAPIPTDMVKWIEIYNLEVPHE